MIAVLAGALSCALAVGCAAKAPEGRGLLPPPSSPPVVLLGSPGPHPFAFAADGSGTLERAIFTSDEVPGMRVTVRDYAVPPRQPTFPIAVSGATLVEMYGQGGTVIVDGQGTTFKGEGWMGVQRQSRIVLVNDGDHPMMVRLYTFGGGP